MTRDSRRPLALLLSSAVLTSAWVALGSGLVQVRACFPATNGLDGAHLAFLRPAADCPSGLALDETGLSAVVGTVALTTLFAALSGLSAVSGIWAVLARTSAAVRATLGAVLPRPLRVGVLAVPQPRSRVHDLGSTLVGERLAAVVVGLRAPPFGALQPAPHFSLR